MRLEQLTIVGLTLALFGCTVDENRWDGAVSFRCLPTAGVGMVGLHSVEVAGTPTVSGPYSSVFSNNIVSLAGSYDLEGDAISGGTVKVSGSNSPGGSIIEKAPKLSVADPTEAVRAAKASNDNDRIPCVKQSGDCISPVSNYVLSLQSNQKITLTTGIYYLEGISINGQAKLDIDGDVVIYLDGPATFNGGSATNPDHDALTIISSAMSEIRLNGAAQSAMHIFAPYASVRFAGTQGFKGTTLAGHLRISGTADLEVTGSVADFFDVGCAPSDDAPSSTPSSGKQH
jgi:hypothetical protein